jgi:hypothetical protein
MSEDIEADDSSERCWSSGKQYFPEESTMVLDCCGSGIREVKSNYKSSLMKSPGKAIGDSLVLRKLEINLSLSSEGGKYIGVDVGVDELFHGISRNRSIGLLVLKTNDTIAPTPDIFQDLVPFFEHNDKLGCIDLHGPRSWTLNSLALALSACKNTRMKRINLTNTMASDATAASFFVSLSNVHSLSDLCITKIHLGEVGGDGLAHLLQNSESNLQRLEIHYAQLDDERLVRLGNALTVNKTLKYLDLDLEGFSISVESWQAFSQCLRNPNSALETLKFRDDNDDDDAMSEIVAAIVRALEGNSALKTLDIAVDDCGGGPFIKEWVWELFDRVLCDKTSIAATHSSNHTLQEVNILHYFRDFRDDFEDDDSDCEGMNNFRDSLHVNTTGNKSEVARQKILERHFAGGVTDIQYARGNTDIAQVFSSAPDSVLVHAIEWIGRDDLGYSVMNDFVRGFPQLFGKRSTMQDAADKKRKRQDDTMPSNQEVTVNDRAACATQ